ncbi:hypothetical protein CL653_01315 [bacterium]|nr:hypothetical protein [bacterium]|tara:strand:- start:705 stop:1481 length:777 start_codon:yes stop_codon:yes gene_type:complete
MAIKEVVRKWIWNRTWLARLVFPLVNCFHYGKNLIKYGVADPKIYFVFKGKTLVYLTNSKAAQTTITNTNGNKIKKEYSGLQTGRKIRQLSKEEQEYFKFTFVRNPYERLYSCYRSKLKADKQKYGKRYGDFDFYLLGYLKQDKGFAKFVEKVTKVPYWLSDRHFKPQSYLVYKDNTYPLDLVGRLENIEEEFEPIRLRFELDKLPHLNDSTITKEDWRDAYTPELIDKVTNYYKSDLDLWYPEAEAQLRKYVTSTYS